MSSASTMISDIPGSVPSGKTEKPEKKPKPAPAPQPEPERKPRRVARRDTINRAYYVCLVNDLGEISKMIAKFPTVGQARKHRDLVTKAAGFAPSTGRIVRTVIVE